MADAVISIVVERVAAIIEDQIRYEVNLVRGVEKEVLNLSDKLKTIRDVVDDAEKRGVSEQSVKNWLKKLENTAYEMDDILDEWNYTLLKHKMEFDQPTEPRQKVCCSFIPSSSCLCFKKVVVRRDTAKKIRNVKATLDKILREKDEFNFVVSQPTTDHVPKPWRIQSTSSIDLEKVYGRERDRNNIVTRVMANGDSQVVCIVGMGGLGKTTLAQLVYNDARVKECFELRIWICVSDPFNVDGIARGIVNSVGRESIPQGTNQLELVLQKLRNSVLGKKFLLVLDDVWTEDYNMWEPLRINLRYGAEGSKILVTTRNERVAKMMGTLDDNTYRLEQLSDEECWKVLCGMSFLGRGEEEIGEFEDVGKKIASKCNGLPLAAIVMGSLLQSKNSVEEWESVLESEIWRLEKAEVELFPHLLLSYNELSPSLKRCFSYCAVYPKDYRINVQSLIENWMAQGYLGSVGGNGGAEAKGQDYFNHLATRSLFQNFEKSDEHIEWCKMHDIVHDFALFLRKTDDRVEASEMTERSCEFCDLPLVFQVKEYRSLILGEGSSTNICDCLSSLRMLSFGGGLSSPPQGMEKLIHLRWLDLSCTELSKDDLEIIFRLYFLQTLLLAFCSLVEIPEEIGNLVHLRHLDLHGNGFTDLPESTCSLVELRILNVSRCNDLNGLPEGIHRLRNLQHLLYDHTIFRQHFPEGVGELSGLRTLSSSGEFHRGRGLNKLGLLKNLNLLTGGLRLELHYYSARDLEELVEDAREAEMRNKMHIQRLDIYFKDEMGERERSSPSPSASSSSSSLWMDVIEALEPHRKLKRLGIFQYRGSRLPYWISSPLNLIKEIHLAHLRELPSLPPLGKLPFLEVLLMRYLEEVRLVGREFLGVDLSSSTSDRDIVSFPKLKKLTFRFCPNWSEWEDITEEEEESTAISAMPRLTELNFTSCGSLKKLPHRLLRKASSSLQAMTIVASSELQKSYGDEEGAPRRSISCHNPQLRIYWNIIDAIKGEKGRS